MDFPSPWIRDPDLQLLYRWDPNQRAWIYEDGRVRFESSQSDPTGSPMDPRRTPPALNLPSGTSETPGSPNENRHYTTAAGAGSDRSSALFRNPRGNIPATPEDVEPLDSYYRVKEAGFFKVGRVFRILWSEPAGRSHASVITPRDGNEDVISLNRQISRDSRHGEPIFTKIRWLVVIRAGNGRCSCVPIVTYQNQGVAKRGVKKNEHAIAYIHNRFMPEQPMERPVGDEKPMLRPIAIQPDETGDRMELMSRLDYGRLYTVEHGVKAKPFGWVRQESMRDFTYSFEHVFFGRPVLQWSETASSGQSQPQGQQQQHSQHQSSRQPNPSQQQPSRQYAPQQNAPQQQRPSYNESGMANSQDAASRERRGSYPRGMQRRGGSNRGPRG